MKTERLSPSYVALDLTYRCALSCPFCFVRRNRLRGGRELGLAGWLKIIKALGPGRRRFYLTGGEPLLRPFLPGLVKALKAGGNSVIVTTAGRAPAAAAAALAAAGPDEIVLSLHGPRALHDAQAGAGAWNAAMRSLAAMKSARRAGTRINIWCTINRANHRRLPAVWRALSALGADAVAFNHLEFVTDDDAAASRGLLAGAGLATPLRPSEELAGGINAPALAAGAAEVRRLAGDSVKFYPRLNAAGIKAWYSPSARLKRPGFCLGQFNAAWFAPDGALLSCQPLAVRLAARPPDPLGAYNGAAYASLRKLLVRNGGFFPSCRRCGRAPYSSAGRKYA